jgi:hypothetical protein
VFSGVPPDEYIVLTPLFDNFPLFADNTPQIETQEVRISLFSKGNYRKRVNQIVRAILAAGITVTDRRYVGYDNETAVHHYGLDVSDFYVWED